MESLRYDWNQPNACLSQTECYLLGKTYETESKAFPPGSPSDYSDRGGKSLRACFIRKVKYPEWLANVVVVPKKGGKWRVCMDYTNLNDACSKYSFPLLGIVQIVDASAMHGMMSFLDAFFGYHQIPIHLPDVEKTAFITPHGLYCYNVMPFGLKNVGATYQRLVTKKFRPLMGKTMEVYIDHILVKSKECPDHTKYLQKNFELLHTYSMKLNPLKCAFGVSSCKFLGFMVMQRGIEANLIQLNEYSN